MWLSFYNQDNVTNNNVIRFGEGESDEWLRIDNGNVGIGTSSPTGQLHVSSNAGNTITLETFVDNGNDSTFKFHKARGGSGGPSQITAGDDLGTIEWSGYDGSSWNAAASIKVDSTTNTGDFDAIMAFNIGSEVMRIDSSGKVTVTTVDLGNWTITESAGVLYFATSGTNKMKLDASGNLTVVGDVTAYGTI